jgi:putative ABC transport system permease protein
MLKNYLKVALRNLIRNKLHSIIGTIGLSIGIACCILIFLYAQQELTFDQFHDNSNEISRLIRFESESNQLSDGTNSTAPILRAHLIETFPEIKKCSRVMGSNSVVKSENKSFNELVVQVDPDFLTMFSFPILKGDANKALDEPGSVVITPEMANKYFGDDDPIGKLLTIQLGETSLDFNISAVIEEAPANSSIQYNMLISMENLKYSVSEEYLDTWDIIIFSTYIQTHPGTDIVALEDKISNHVSSIFTKNGGDYALSYGLQPLEDIHLNTVYDGEMVASSDPLYSYILSAIAFAVLLIACINFMTLSIGRSSGRAREVGLRKVLGAQRKQLMTQFWGESFIMSIAALAIGFVLAELFLPTFNEIAQKQLSLDIFSNAIVLPALIGLILITAFMAGIYPAILLSNLLPTGIFQKDFKFGGKNRLVQGMVILQFAISIFLIICTLVISSQLNYVNHAKLGYNKNHVVTFTSGTEGEDAASLLDRFRTELSSNDRIIDVTGYSFSLGQAWLYTCFDKEGGQNVLFGEDVTQPGYSSMADPVETYFYVNWVDEGYINTMGMNLIEGRNFSNDHPTDRTDAIIINQKAAKKFGMDNPIGEKLPHGFRTATIIGVVEDFHFYPLHREIDPLVLHMPGTANINSIFNIAVKIKSDDITGTLTMLENTWTNVSDGKPFEYNFLDETIARVYANELNWKKIVQYSSILAVLITCMGLFGLTSLMVSKRTKEVGIRRVLGASASRIVMMFSNDFAKLILISILISWPLAYYIMSQWLNNFAYRTGIGPLLFVLTGLMILVISFITVSIQAVKAALTDPVAALRHE